MINSQIRASYWMTFPLTIVNFNNFFIQPAPGCKSSYIGKTDRCLITRLKEHNNRESSEINAHINSCEHFQHIKTLMELTPDSTETINTNTTQLIFENCKIIDRSDHWSLLLYKESLAIRRRKPELNHGAKASKELIIFQ